MSRSPAAPVARSTRRTPRSPAAPVAALAPVALLTLLAAPTPAQLIPLPHAPQLVDSQPQVIFTTPMTVPVGPLVWEGVPQDGAGYAGQPRIADDGTWYLFAALPIPGNPQPIDYVRDRLMLRDGEAWLREGLVIPGAAPFVPLSDFPLTQQPFEDVAINASGSVAEIVTGTDVYVLDGQGLPSANDLAFPTEDPVGLLLLDRQLVLKDGDEVDILPDVGFPQNALVDLSAAALNDAVDWAFRGRVSGDSSTNSILVRNGEVAAQEGDLIDTASGPRVLQLGNADANIRMGPAGNLIWYAAWNALASEVCPDNRDLGSSFAIWEGLCFNDELLLEAGRTVVRDVPVGDTLFPALVVDDLPNTLGGFALSPDGRRLIVGALLAEPSPDLCTYSINDDVTPVASAVLTLDLGPRQRRASETVLVK